MSTNQPTPVLYAIWSRDPNALLAALLDTPTDAIVASAAGISPLSLCFRLRFIIGAKILIAYGAPLTRRDAAGSLPPLYWACALGGIHAESAAAAATHEAAAAAESRARNLCRVIASSPDFTATLFWGVKVPALLALILGDFLPRDELRVIKRGAALRVDFKLSGFDRGEGRGGRGVMLPRPHWTFGDFSLLVANDCMCIVDNQLKRFANVTARQMGLPPVPSANGVERAGEGAVAAAGAVVAPAGAVAAAELAAARWPAVRYVAGSASTLHVMHVRSGTIASLIGAGPIKTCAIGQWPACRMLKCDGVSLCFFVREPLDGGGAEGSTSAAAASASTSSATAASFSSAAVSGARVPSRASVGGRVGATLASFFLGGRSPSPPPPRDESDPPPLPHPLSSPLAAPTPQRGCSLSRHPAVTVLGEGGEGLPDRTLVAPPPIRTVKRSFEIKVAIAPWEDVPLSRANLVDAMAALLGARGADAAAALTSFGTFIEKAEGMPVSLKINLVPALGVKVYVRLEDFAARGGGALGEEPLGIPEGYVDASELWHANAFFAA